MNGNLWWLSGRESACNAGHVGSITGQGVHLEKEMVTHSSILVWGIPWTEEPAGYSPGGWSQRVGQDLATKQ